MNQPNPEKNARKPRAPRVPKGGAKITGTPEKGLTIDVVELNTASYFTYLQRKARESAEKSDQKNASFTKQ